jgi:hypothetical protein
MSEQGVEKLGGLKNPQVLRVTHEHAGQTLNEKGIAVDALLRYAISSQPFIYKGFPLLKPYITLPPLRKRINSDFKTLHPLPAFVALIRPQRMYLKKVGLVILRY